MYSVSTVFRLIQYKRALWTQNTRIIHDVWRLLILSNEEKLMIIKILKKEWFIFWKKGGSREKGEEETKYMPHEPVITIWIFAYRYDSLIELFLRGHHPFEFKIFQQQKMGGGAFNYVSKITFNFQLYLFSRRIWQFPEPIWRYNRRTRRVCSRHILFHIFIWWLVSIFNSNFLFSTSINFWLGLGLWCLTPLLTIFQLNRGGQFYWWSKSEYPEKTQTFRKSLTNFIT